MKNYSYFTVTFYSMVNVSKLIKKKQSNGILNAIIEYAHLRENGIGIDFDKKEEAEFYKLAAQKGDQDAMYKYACMRENGIGVDADKEALMKMTRNLFNRCNDDDEGNNETCNIS